MSQNDFTIANQTFPNTRADINLALQALASTSSGTSAPSTTFANQFWYDTSANTLYIRNEDNDANITLAVLDQSNDTVEYFKSDSIRTALIEFTDGDDALTIADGGALTTAGNLSIGGSNNELRFYEGANYVGFEAPALSGDKIWVLPSADGSSGQVLTTNGSATLSWATSSGGKVKQVVTASDATLYALSISNATSDHAGSIAYSITPSSSSNKVMIHFTIPQVKHAQHAGLRVRLYRDIGGAGYSHVTALSGTASSNKQAALFGNYDTNGDGNRSATTITGTIVDSPSTTSQVSYKFYFGAGDGATTVYVNRTQNDTDNNYTSRTRTHVSLMEIE